MKPHYPAERIEFSRPVDLPGVEIMRVEDSARRWRVFHETYTITSILDASGGIGEWSYRGKIHSSKAGDISVLEPGEIHANTRITPPANFRVLFVSLAAFDRQAKESGMASSHPHLKLANISNATFFRAFAQLHQSLETEATTLERQSRFAACLHLILEHCTEKVPEESLKQPNRAALFRARDFIREYFSEDISLDELVVVTGLSRFHLVRAFAAEFGIPPHAYQNQLRLTKAQELISAGVPLAITAAEVGFADQSHFARHFKKTFQITPGEYARQIRFDRAIHLHHDEVAI